MTALPRPESRLRTLVKRAGRNRTVLWIAFVLTHLLLGFQNLNESGTPLGDVIIQYKYWAEQADFAGYYVGIDKEWVYPIVAMVPILIAAIFGFNNYAGAWLALVFVLDLIAFAAMVGWRRRSDTIPYIGWWWIGFLLLLGPIAMGRIDSISVPIAIVAVLLLARRPRVAAFLLTIATWIKVWPAALIAAVIVASKARIRFLVTVLITSILIIAIAMALGSGFRVFSFVTQQTSRGLQVESPVSTIWMWMSYAHVPGAFPYYNIAINTFEVGGPDATAVAALLTPLLALVVLVVVILGIVAVQRGAVVTELLAPLALALVSAFIAFNKVGSPQYMTWLAVPIILGIATHSMGYGRSFQIPGFVAIVAAGLTQIFYPVEYLDLLRLNAVLLIDLTVRNILILVLFGWSVGILIRLTRPFVAHDKLADPDAWLPAAWPFQLHPSRLVEADATTDEDPATP